MGQAKRRGSFEERAASPRGNPHHREWTEEDRQRFVAELKPSITRMVDGFRKSLFSTTPQKTKPKRIRTGG